MEIITLYMDKTILMYGSLYCLQGEEIEIRT